MVLLDYQLRRNVTYIRRRAEESHYIREYETLSMYRRSYTFMVNNSLVFMAPIPAPYRLMVR